MTIQDRVERALRDNIEHQLPDNWKIDYKYATAAAICAVEAELKRGGESEWNEMLRKVGEWNSREGI